MGGEGSGSKPGKDANNYKDGRRIYSRLVRGKTCSKCGGAVSGNNRVVHHATAIKRDEHGNAKEHNNSGRVMCKKCHDSLKG